MIILYLFACFLAGVCITIQAATSAALSNATKLPSFATLMSFILALIPLFIYYAIESRGFKDGKYTDVKWWHFIGGILAGLDVFTIIWTVPKLGATIVLSFTIVGQVLLGLLIDHFGWLDVAKRAISLWRCSGVALIIIGGILLGVEEFLRFKDESEKVSSFK